MCVWLSFPLWSRPSPISVYHSKLDFFSHSNHHRWVWGSEGESKRNEYGWNSDKHQMCVRMKIRPLATFNWDVMGEISTKLKDREDKMLNSHEKKHKWNENHKVRPRSFQFSARKKNEFVFMLPNVYAYAHIKCVITFQNWHINLYGARCQNEFGGSSSFLLFFLLSDSVQSIYIFIGCA